MHCRTQRRRLGAFTLIELLVAISILAVVAVLGWRGLDGIIRARVAITADMEQLRGIQIAFAQLQSDCTQIVSPGEFPDHPPIIVDDGRITLLRTVAIDQQPTQFAVVSYRFVDGALTRQESASSRNLPELDAAWREAISGADAGHAVVLQNGLDSMVAHVFQDPAVGLEVELRIKGHGAGVNKIFLIGSN